MALLQSNLKLYGLVSTSLFIWTVLHAFRERSNFYSAAVYLSKSNASLMILWNQGIYQTILFGKVVQWIFFGELRIIEVERLQERGWFAVTETLLALTIFKDEFDTSFVMLFVSLLFLKVFHWLAADRVEMMEQSAHIPRRFHLRMGGLLSLLWIFDVLLLAFAVESVLLDGPTVMIMFASEYMIMLAAVLGTTLKYALNIIDLRSEVPWEEKSIYVFYVDLATDFFKLATYLTFFCLILTFYGLPLNILRDVYVTFRSFVHKVRDLRRYRQATRNMDSLYPDATLEEMERMDDKTCIICREDMEHREAAAAQAPPPAGEAERAAPAPAPATPAVPRTGPNDTPKKLPCGHVFHFHCLRSWLERQQSCPTCRRPVLPQDQTRAQAAAADVAARAPPAAVPGGDDAIRQAQINLARNLGREAFDVVFPDIPFPPEALLPAALAAQRPPPHQHQPRGVVPPAPAVAEAAAGPASRDGTTPSPPATRVTGVGGDNPLARFSLPELRLPPTGEAGLYSPPPSATTSHGYAGVAYGAYPHPQLMRGVGQAAGSQSRVPNLEERLAHIRTRMTQAVAQADGGQNAVLAPTPEGATTAYRTTPTPTAPLATPATVSLPSAGPSSTTSDATSPTATTPQLSAREAALAAAERRAQACKSNGVPSTSTSNGALSQRVNPEKPSFDGYSLSPTASTSPLPPVTSPASHAASPSPLTPPPPPSTIPPTGEHPPTPSLSRPLNGAPPRPSPDFFSLGSSSSPAGPSSSAPSQSGTPASYPRLIPLFNPSNPLATTLYPHLLSSMPPSLAGFSQPSSLPRPLETRPLVPESPTEEQLRELSQLTRSGIEERLRVLVGFQERMAALASDMGKVLSVLPPEEDGEQQGNGTKVDKGKAPVEGIHAVAKDEAGSTVEGGE